MSAYLGADKSEKRTFEPSSGGMGIRLKTSRITLRITKIFKNNY